MRDSIRQHITTLVDTLPFTSSEIPERIIEEVIATPTESESLRKLGTTEDQVSGLVYMENNDVSEPGLKFQELLNHLHFSCRRHCKEMGNKLMRPSSEARPSSGIDVLHSVDPDLDTYQQARLHNLIRCYVFKDGFNKLMLNSNHLDPWHKCREARKLVKNSFREECMRDAIRQHITTIVADLPFNQCDIPDRIIEEGIATPKESESLRKLKTTDDQVSGLVSMVITKDFTAMEKFLAIVEVHNTEVVVNIRHVFNAMIEVPIGSAMPCVVCDLKQKCDIKVVYNHFFAKKQISAGLHRRIVQSELPVGSQDMLWNDMLNELGNKTDCGVIYILVEAMEHDGCCNTNLIKLLKRLLRKNEPLKCSCNTQVKLIPRSNSLASSTSSSFFQVQEARQQVLS